MLIIARETYLNMGNGAEEIEITKFRTGYRKAINFNSVSEMYADDDELVINVVNEKQTGLRAKYCLEVYGLSAAQLFDDIIWAYKRGDKVFELRDKGGFD